MDDDAVAQNFSLGKAAVFFPFSGHADPVPGID